MQKYGIEILVNDVRQIRRGTSKITLVGVDDYWTGFPSVPLEATKTSPQDVRVLISHNPDYASAILERTEIEFDIALCGHTHGGQIKLPLVGAPHYNVKDLRFKEGLYVHPRGLVYTTRGLGMVELPWRINCPPEVTVLELRAKSPLQT